MNVNWEGEVDYNDVTYYVHADFNEDYDSRGEAFVEVHAVAAFNEAGQEQDLGDDYWKFADHVAAHIQDQLENAA